MKRTLNKKGFTLMEVLIAIGVIAILCAIAIPAIVRANKSLDEQQSDDYAKSIFLAAQDSVSDMRTDASLNTLSGTVAYKSIYAGDSIIPEIKNVLSEELQNKLINEDLNREYNYITSDDEGFNEILPEDSIDPSIRGQKIIIIFNPTTGDVFYVKYGDKGEYSGSVVNKAADIVNTEPVCPTVSCTNGEEFLFKINVPIHEEYANSSKIQSYYDAITYHITVTDATNSANTFTYNFNSKSGGDFSFNYATGMGTWILDSLNSGHSFADKNANASEKSGSAIPAGNDVVVSVTYDFDADYAGGNEIEFDSTNSSLTANPLFAKRSGNVITVSNGRHLQNLNSIDEAVAAQLAAADGSKVVLGSNISWGNTVAHYQKYSPNFKSFSSLVSAKLFADGSKVVFDGANHSIINLYVNNSGDAGLFTNLYGTVQNLTFVDPIIKGTANCGTLAANASKAVIKNCAVLIQTVNNSVTDNISSGTAVADLSSDLYGVVSSGSENCVGMLCGYVCKGTSITKCEVNMLCDSGTAESKDDTYSSVPASSRFFGLLCGSAEVADITDTYVYGDITGGISTDVGLLLGYGDNVTVSGIDIGGTIKNTSSGETGSVGGVVGELFNSSVSYVTIQAAKFTIDNVIGSNIGVVIGKAIANNDTWKAKSIVSNVSIKSGYAEIKNIDGSKVGASDQNVGLIGTAQGGIYSDFTASIVSELVKYADIGGIIGKATDLTLKGKNNIVFTLGTDKLANTSGNSTGNILGCHVGGLIGYSTNCIVEGVSSVKDTFTNLFNCQSIGGAIGYAENGTYSGIDVSTGSTMRNIVAPYIGGAFGHIFGGTFHDIDTAANMTIQYVWSLADNASNISTAFGTYANPSSQGYAGKFVGFFEKGSINDCSATGTSAGTANSGYANLQFVGVVKPTACQAIANFYESVVKFLETVDAEKYGSSANTYKQKNGTALFTPATQYYQYKDITLKNCIYTNASKVKYNQEICSDKYYYTLSSRDEGTVYKFKEIEGEYNYSDTTPFIVLDDTRSYAFVLNANYQPEATLYYVDGMLDYFPKDTYTKDTSSTTPIYFFNKSNTSQTYQEYTIPGVTGLVYEKDNPWPVFKTVLRENRFNIIDTYFILNDTQNVKTDYDHVVYDVGSYSFDFGKTKGVYNVMDYVSNQSSSRTSYRSGQIGDKYTFRVKNAYVYTNVVKYELSSLAVEGFDGESSEVIIRDANFYSTFKNALWQNVSLTDAGFNAGERSIESNYDGNVMLRNMQYQTVTRTLSGKTSTDNIYLTIADDDQYAASRGTYMTPSKEYERVDVSSLTERAWKADWNINGLAIENHVDENGDTYTTISRNWKNGNPFYLGMLGDELYTKHAGDMSDSSYNHLHLYALISGENGENGIVNSFSPADSPAQIITSTKVS